MNPNIVYSVVDKLHSPTIIIEPVSKKFIFANSAFCDLSKYKKDELLKMSISDISSDFTEKIVYEKELELLENYKEIIRDFEIETKEKEKLIFKGFLSLTQDNDEKYIFITGNGTSDIETVMQREIESKAYEFARHRSMENLITHLSHNWRQPLTSISMSCENIEFLLEELNIDNPEIESDLESINHKTQYLSKLIDNFRDIVGKEVSNEKFELFSFLKEIITTALTYKREDLEIDLFFEYSIENAPIIGSVSSLKKIIFSILTNAQEAIAKRDLDRGLVIISLDEEDQYYKLSISNNGVPLTYEERKKVFEPYYSTKFLKNDVGLSLYHNKLLIERIFNGLIDIDLEYEDGAKFNIYFPKQINS